MFKNLKIKTMNFFRKEDGATAIEYGLIVGLIAALLVTVLTAIGTGTNTLFGVVSGAIVKAAG